MADPPDGVGDEVETLRDIVAFNRVHQANISFGDEIREGHALILILFGDIDDESEIGFNQHVLGELVAGRCL